MVVDGYDDYFVDKVLSNVINQEQEIDADWKTLKNVQKEAVIGIQCGSNWERLKIILDSFVPIEMAEYINNK
ncbi:hypothetical protein AGMMS50267_00560 [Spirochaetia bacterium]|nr:hypothetical protein AGMMS50267_00560 [Spirochaetia bacterium]